MEIRLQGGGEAGNIRLQGKLRSPQSEKELTLSPVPGLSGLYQARLTLAQRGAYQVQLNALSGTDIAEKYERTINVEPTINEGGSPELKEAYLKELATKAGGIYTSERDFARIQKFLQERVYSQHAMIPQPLVNDESYFPILCLALLFVEWFVRRRFNLI